MAETSLDAPIREKTAAAVPPLPWSLSQLSLRRLANFRANRRGYWSFWAFIALCLIALFAPFIANEKPVLVSYKGEFFFPVFIDYPESTFGGFLATTDYKDPHNLEEINAHGWMLWPPIRYGPGTINQYYPRLKAADGSCLGFPAPPFWATRLAPCPEATPEQIRLANEWGNVNWLGTDDLGRDVVARLLYGFRISIAFGLLLTILSSIIGVVVGAVQGFYGGIVDLSLQRLIEIWTSVPSLYVLIIISAVLTPGFWTLLGILLLFEWTSLEGLVRAEFLRGRNFDYINAARALGLNDWQIMFKHLLPNAMVATVTFLPFILSSSVTALTAVDYLGLGLPPGSASLGEMLTQATANVQAPWLGLSGFFTIALLLSLVVFIGEAVRDALDPRKIFR